MVPTIADVMRHVRNYFETGYFYGQWTVKDGVLSPDALQPGDWLAIAQNGRVHTIAQLDEFGLLPSCPDMSWTGRIWQLAPPADFLRLCGDIADWVKAHPDPTLLSEHFGQYSRSQSGAAWQRVFAEALRPWRRMYSEVERG